MAVLPPSRSEVPFCPRTHAVFRNVDRFVVDVAIGTRPMSQGCLETTVREVKCLPWRADAVRSTDRAVIEECLM